MKTTKLMAGLALVASTLLTTAPVLAQDQTNTSTAQLTVEPGVRNINKVPTLDFDKVQVSGDIAVTPINNPEGIELSDYTGSLSGWTLNVKRSAFTATINSDTATLDGVTLKLTGGSFGQSDDVADTTKDTVTANVELGTVDTNATVATAGKGTGTGSTTINYTGATLDLPETITKGKVKAGSYTSTLTWTLTDAPTD